jgi:hypothetical protein
MKKILSVNVICLAPAGVPKTLAKLCGQRRLPTGSNAEHERAGWGFRPAFAMLLNEFPRRPPMLFQELPAEVGVQI